MHPDVAAYIDHAPPRHRPHLEDLRAMIYASFPEAEEGIDRGCPMYRIDGEWVAGFASGGEGIVFHIMALEVLAAFADRLGKLVTGESSIAYAETDDLALQEARALVMEMLEVAAARRD